jgi:hypothetical protein
VQDSFCLARTASRSLLAFALSLEWKITTDEALVEQVRMQISNWMSSGTVLTTLKGLGLAVSGFVGSALQNEPRKGAPAIEVFDPTTGALFVDRDPPVIYLGGSEIVNLQLSSKPLQFKDPGATALDQFEGDLTPFVRANLLNGTVMDLTQSTPPGMPYLIRYYKLVQDTIVPSPGFQHFIKTVLHASVSHS